MPDLKTHLKNIRLAKINILRDFGGVQRIEADPIYKYLQNYAQRPSKGLRALLLVLSYLGYSGRKASGSIYRWATALEIIQDFVLIHDDLVDNAMLRRGAPALQHGLAKIPSGDKTLGKNLALICGDLLYTVGLRTFLDMDLPLGDKERALKILLDSAAVTALGEIRDLTGRDLTTIKKADIYKLCDQKTGEYSFVTPLCCGAAAAGKNSAELKRLRALGMALGRAFQLRDDLTDITGEVKNIGKDILGDIKNSKLTLLAFYAYARSTPKVKQKILKIFAKQQKTPAEIAYIKKIYQQSGAIELVKNKIVKCSVRAQRELAGLKLNADAKDVLWQLAEKLK